jgi:hypothetical protein
MISRAPLNSIHHLMGLPLATVYFVLLITGLSVGGGLAVIGVGVPILLATLWLVRPLGELERRLANSLLGTHIDPAPQRDRAPGAIAWAKDLVTDPQTWRGLAYLVARLPLAIVSFSITVALLAAGIGLAAAPVRYWTGDVDLGFGTLDSALEALAVAPLGVAILVAAVPVVAGLGSLQAVVARSLLAQPTPSASGAAMPLAA